MDLDSVLQGLRVDRKEVAALFSEAGYDSEKVKEFSKRKAADLSTYDNSLLAGRLLLYDTIKPCATDIRTYVKFMFRRLDEKIADFMLLHADRLNAEIKLRARADYDRDDIFSASVKVKGYLMRPTYGEDPLETPQQMYLRIAVQFYHDRGVERVIQCYDEMSVGYYTPATPTIFNAGTKRPQMASCFLIQIGDDLESILYTGVGDSGMISKDNGGLGIGLKFIRHSMIRDVGMSSGVLKVARLYDRLIGYVDQGGKRDGAGTGFLPPHHIDAVEFVQATDNYKAHDLRLTNLNTCLWMSRLFFKRVEAKAKWTLFCPAKTLVLNQLYGWAFEQEYIKMEALATERQDIFTKAESRVEALKNALITNPDDESLQSQYLDALEAKIKAHKELIEHKIINAEEFYELIISNQSRSGMPYIMHGDSANAKSNQKNLGPIHSSNLCLEIIERSTPEEIASCNLSSINMAAFVTGVITVTDVNDPEFLIQLRRAYDFEKHGQITQSAVQNLEEVIDKNFYPLDKREDGKVVKAGKIRGLNQRTRPLGIGISGYADSIWLMDLCYEDPRTSYWNKIVFACQYFNGLIASIRLAAEKGPYAEYNTGSYQQYVGLAPDGVPIFVTRTGSPISNGQLQFDLWNEEAQQLEDLGELDYKVYNRLDDIPIAPEIWGQKAVTIKCADGKEVIIEPTWESLKAAIKLVGVRHSQIFALMPTAQTANMFRNAESTEAHQSNIYSRATMYGTYTVVNRHLVRDLEQINCWNPGLIQFIAACKGSVRHMITYIEDHPTEFSSQVLTVDTTGQVVLEPKVRRRLEYLIIKYKTMFEISQKFCMLAARQRAIYICQSCSSNVYMSDPEMDKMKALHSYGNKLGLKTGMYYLRQDPAKAIGDFNLDPRILAYYLKFNTRVETYVPPVRVEACRRGSQSCDTCAS